jgi:hypothetical protein
MKKQRLLLILFFLILVVKSFSQDVKLSQPRLEPDGNQLVIFYDIVSKDLSDQFYIWVEIKKSNGELIKANSISGDVGANVKAGNNKKIIWSPEKDSVYLDDEVSVEVKAEKYIKSFNKGSMILKSMAFPGWGQTEISNGKPWWIAGIAVYGTLAGGIIYHKKYLDSYEAYKVQEDPVNRAGLLDQTQKYLNTSTVMLYTAASAWAVNVLWVALTPYKYQPLKNAKISFYPATNPSDGSLLMSLRLDF